MTNKNIERLILKYTKLPLECDGLTKVISYILTKHNIKHIVCIGNLIIDNKSILHYWIELPNKDIIDYRARMWFGNNNTIPNGIFNPTKYKNAKYVANKKLNLKVSEFIFKILTNE